MCYFGINVSFLDKYYILDKYALFGKICYFSDEWVLRWMCCFWISVHFLDEFSIFEWIQDSCWITKVILSNLWVCKIIQISPCALALMSLALKECGHTQTINIINGVCLMKEELLGCTMASLQMKRVIFYPFVIESD